MRVERLTGGRAPGNWAEAPAWFQYASSRLRERVKPTVTAETWLVVVLRTPWCSALAHTKLTSSYHQFVIVLSVYPSTLTKHIYISVVLSNFSYLDCLLEHNSAWEPQWQTRQSSGARGENKQTHNVRMVSNKLCLLMKCLQNAFF